MNTTVGIPKTVTLSDRVVRQMAENADLGKPLTGNRLAEALTELLALRWAKRRDIKEKFPLGTRLIREDGA